MAEWDASAIASVAALIVAVIALITAFAQALQQYFITGQLIRMCDSVVFGPLPGQGRRIWQFRQFRFRVLYSIPQISLRADLWPSTGSYHVKSYAIGRHPLPELGNELGPAPAVMTTATPSDDESDEWTLRRRRRPGFQETESSFVGEASWASFCRAIEIPCGDSVRLDHVQYDADRCPTDLISAPMQVSMRDIIIMALMSGMEITSASFEEKSVSMQGAAGTLTSSKHAVLGPILHFTPRIVYERHAFAFGFHMTGERGFVSNYWLARTWGVCCVARRYFNWIHRRTTRRLDDRWIRDQDDAAPKFFSEESEDDEYSSPRRKTKGWARDIVPTESNDKRKKKKGGFGRGDGERKEVVKIMRATAEIRPQDGEWTISIPPVVPKVEIISEKGQGSSDSKTGQPHRFPPSTERTKQQTETTVDENTKPPKPSRRATVEDVSDHGEEDLRSHRPVNHKEKPDRQLDPSTGIRVSPEGLSNDGKDRVSPQSPLPPGMVLRVEPVSIGDSDGVGEEEGPHRADVENDPELLERVRKAKALQAARAEKLSKIQRDKDLVEESMKRGVITSPYDEAAGRKTPLLLTWNPSGDGDDAGETRENEDGNEQEDDQPTKEEEEARQRELDRARERDARERERDERNKTRNRATDLHYVDVYWMSQMDVMRGYWATPWHNASHTPIYSSLTGCVTVVLEALLGFMGSEYIVYTGGDFDVSFSFRETAAWMCEPYYVPVWRRGGNEEAGESSYNHTYPAYAHNARGGVIAAGQYVGCRIASFPGRIIPVLELAHSYDWQVYNRSREQADVEEQNVELMRIDSWLSYVGRLDEISDGPHQLLRQTPALLYLLMQEYQIDFQNIDLSAKEGGLQDIQGLAANLMDFLTDEELTEAEQLYVLVALLRTVKVAQCVLGGSDTEPLDDILRRDVQAHLV